MNAKRTLCQTLCAAAVIGAMLTGCDRDLRVGEAEQPISASAELTVEDPKAAEIRVVRGLLRHSPQDVKSMDAWLGQEFMVGETPIRATEQVPRDELMKMVGKKVEIEGTWNEGSKWEPPKPTEDEFQLQTPSIPDGVTVVTGAGIEATSVVQIEN